MCLEVNNHGPRTLGLTRPFPAPPVRVVTTWTRESGRFADTEMLVALELAAIDGGTERTRTHQDLDGAEACGVHAGGRRGSPDGLERFLV